MSFELEPKTIALGNDWNIVAYLEEQTKLTKWAGKAGLTVTGFISITNGNAATAIGSLTVTLAPAFSTDGAYKGTLSGGAITTGLAAYVGQKVYEIVKIAGQVVAYQELLVIDGRPALDG